MPRQELHPDELNQTLGTKKLPFVWVGGLVNSVDRHSWLVLASVGLFTYVFLVLCVTCVECVLVAAYDETVAVTASRDAALPDLDVRTEWHVMFGNWRAISIERIAPVDKPSIVSRSVKTLPELLYFNFVTILTIGYGDYTPMGWGRFLSILEGVAGLLVFGILTGVTVLKMTTPKKTSVIFSKTCYYILEKQRFLVVFLNANRKALVFADMCSQLKFKRDFALRESYSSPYVGGSAWTFMIDRLPLGELISQPIDSEDSVKFAVRGSYGFAHFSAGVRYDLNKVIMLSSRNLFTEAPEFETPSLVPWSRLRRLFSSVVEEGVSLREFQKSWRRDAVRESLDPGAIGSFIQSQEWQTEKGYAPYWDLADRNAMRVKNNIDNWLSERTVPRLWGRERLRYVMRKLKRKALETLSHPCG